MSRLKVQPELWSDHRFGVLQAAIGLSQCETVGVLVLFWLATRQAGAATLDAGALNACLPCSNDTRDKLREALIRANYVADVGAGDYRVCDNVGYFQTHEKMVAAGRKGGKARLRTPAATPKPSATSQSRANNAAAWEAYRKAYLGKWRVEPVSNAKNRSHIAQIVARVGGADAPGLLTFYVQHNDRMYVAKQHDLGLAVRDCHGLLTQYRRGAAITSNDLREFDGQQRVLSQMERLRAGL